MSINPSGSGALVSARGQHDPRPIPARGIDSVCAEATSQSLRNSVTKVGSYAATVSAKVWKGAVFR